MTWIIPKTLLTTYPSVLDTKGLGLDLEEFSQTCEKSLTLRGKDMPQHSWQRKWKQENWLQHLSTRMLKPSHTEDFLDKWISSQQVFHVNHFQVLEGGSQPKTHDTYSPSSSKELNNVDQSLSSLKMSKASSPQKQETEKVFSNMSSEVWKKWITQQRLEYSQRVKSMHLTREKEFSSWPTPTVAEAGKIGKTPYGQKGLSNHPQVIGEVITRPKMNKSRKGEKMNWPTPTSGMWKQDVGDQGQYAQRVKDKGHQVMLPSAVKLWPTPRARDYKDGSSIPPSRKKNPELATLGQKVLMHGQVDPMNDNTPGKHQELSTPKVHLNPNWVEQLMGLSLGWTDLGFWATELSQQQPKKHLESLQIG